jgi:glycosyltransferase involved in cell wall biosynthesis
VSAIHHFAPVVHGGDAVGRHTLRLRDATRARGFSSQIYVDVIDDDTKEETVSVLDYPAQAQRGDVLVYQFATASNMAAWLAARGETLVVNYHNVTPPELIAPWDDIFAVGQVRAHAELRAMASRTTLAVADSAFNQRHLVEAGFSSTAVVPPSAALGADVLAAGTSTRHALPSSRPGARWLSVGRLAPNKAAEDTIAALAVTRAHHDPDATLLIIGKSPTAAYDGALRRYVAELGLVAAVTFAGHASDAAVAAAYAQSDVLVVTSEHEGFCVPLVEAMTVGLPVVAYRAGALPEVLGQAGVYVGSKDPFELASAIADLLADGPRRDRLSDAAAQRLVELDLGTAAERLVDLLCSLVEQGGVSR